MITVGVFILIATIKSKFLEHLEDASPTLKNALCLKHHWKNSGVAEVTILKPSWSKGSWFPPKAMILISSLSKLHPLKVR